MTSDARTYSDPVHGCPPYGNRQDDMLEYIRDRYRVPAYRGVRVVADGQPGTIVGSTGPYVIVKQDDAEVPVPYHPTWNMVYQPVGVSEWRPE